MFGFKYHLWGFIAALTVGAVWPNLVHAMDLSKPLPKRSAKEVLHHGPSSAFFEQYDQGVQGNCTPLLSHLNEKLQSADSDVRYSAQLVYAEMYDRAVCVEYSPKKSFEYFKQAADAGGPAFYAHVGWKYSYGHGVEKSEAKANEAFKLLLTRGAFTENSRTYKRYEDLLKDRPIPPLLKEGIEWLIETTSTDDGLIELAQALLDGSGRYLGRSPLQIDQISARNILSQTALFSPKARFILGIEYLKGSFDDKNRREGEMHLMWAAQCGYVPAMLKLAQLSETGDYGVKQNKQSTYGWYHMARENGADVASEVEKAKQKIGSYLQRSIQHDHRFKVNMKRCH
ncbi:tetratricopeptide repeat protein [Terasakiella brassicae]|nr:SEL1-like repeat protein [Terasakiella brassicae]